MKMPDIKSLTLREKLAQLCLVRACDLLMHADSSYTTMREPQEAKELMEKYQFGGIWLHGAQDVNTMNPEIWKANVHFDTQSLRKWYRDIVENVKIPVIAANDTGGKNMCSDLSSYPSGMVIGANQDPDAGFKVASCIAREVSLAGINWIWTPIVDYGNRLGAGVTRVYSNLPDDLIRCGISYMKGYQSQNVAATAKHFPGADRQENRDSHIVTTMIRTDKETWQKEQGRIFQAVIDAGVDSVMVGAKAFPAVDDSKLGGRYRPAALSHKIVTGLLREEMGFDGVVITDDVTMGGYTSFLMGGKLYAEFIKAGCDVLLGVGVDAVDLLEEEVKCGNLSEELVDNAVRRIFAMKEKYGLFEGYPEPALPLQEAITEAVTLTQQMSKEILSGSATLICDRHHQVPFDPKKLRKVAIICYSHVESTMTALEAMKDEFERHGAEVLLRRRLESYEDAKAIADQYDLIVYAGFIAHHAPKGAPSFYGDEFWSLRYAFVYGKEKSVGVSLGWPHIHYNFMDDADVFVNLYSPVAEGQRVFVRGLLGEQKFVGKSPVELDQ